MHPHYIVKTVAIACMLSLPIAAHAGSTQASPMPAQQAPGARLISVVPKDGGCVAGPSGLNVEAWDVQPGSTYTITIDHVTDCANGGSDATIQLIIKSASLGNTVVTANRIGSGVYAFDYQMPFSACETNPIQYCTSNGSTSTGLVVGRHDTGLSQSHLRASTFGPGCTGPTPISCLLTPVRQNSWGTIKQYYR